MNVHQFRSRLSVLLMLAIASPASAQIDRVYKTDGKTVSGRLGTTSSRGVQIESGGQPQAIVAGDIVKILYEGDPASLTRGREFVLAGQLEEAADELRKIDLKSIEREESRADAAFYIGLVKARRALAGQGDVADAVKTMKAFASKYRNSWHLFDAAKTLGDLALLADDTENATRYYGLLASAASARRKLESVYLLGNVDLAADRPDEALVKFDRVIDVTPQTPEAARLQTLAKTGKAVALSRQGDAEAGLKIIKELIAELNPSDVELAAHIYNAQGNSYDAMGDDEGALLAFLRTHLLFSSQPDTHFEALRRLVDLWTKAGKPDRAARAREELRTRYPGLR